MRKRCASVYRVLTSVCAWASGRRVDVGARLSVRCSIFMRNQVYKTDHPVIKILRDQSTKITFLDIRHKFYDS